MNKEQILSAAAAGTFTLGGDLTVKPDGLWRDAHYRGRRVGTIVGSLRSVAWNTVLRICIRHRGDSGIRFFLRTEIQVEDYTGCDSDR